MQINQLPMPQWRQIVKQGEITYSFLFWILQSRYPIYSHLASPCNEVFLEVKKFIQQHLILLLILYYYPFSIVARIKNWTILITHLQILVVDKYLISQLTYNLNVDGCWKAVLICHLNESTIFVDL